MKKEATAADAYAGQRARSEGLLEAISTLLRTHAERHANDPGNWDLAGDLGHVNEQLGEVVRFLGGREDA